MYSDYKKWKDKLKYKSIADSWTLSIISNINSHFQANNSINQPLINKIKT